MLQILIYGAVSSAIYAMLAVGFTLIFGVARILNLAHGSFYALGAYAAYVLTSLLGVPLFIAAPLAVLIVAGFGVVMERFLVASAALVSARGADDYPRRFARGRTGAVHHLRPRISQRAFLRG